MRHHNFKSLAGIALLLLLAACSGTDKDADKKRTAEDKAERYSVLPSQSAIGIDPGMDNVAVELPEPISNVSWPQRGANATNGVGALRVNGFSRKQSAEIGDGIEWNSVLVTQPVVLGDVIYAMDAQGYISAHPTSDIDKRLWLSSAAAVGEDEEVLGGGMAVAGGQVFISTGQGDVIALNRQNGETLWRRNLSIPVRSAPKLQAGLVFVQTVDDQVYALNMTDGKIAWQHRGIGESVGFLSPASPAIGDNFLVVGYSSGELYGLSQDTGQEIWNDSLILSRKTSATSVFTGFTGDPVMAGGVVFAASSNGLTAATHLLTGRRIWEQEVSAIDTPWLLPNFLFLLTPDAQVVALYIRDGRIKWVHQLEKYGDPEDKEDPRNWHGPVMLNDRLAVLGEHGKMIFLSPETGRQLEEQRIPDGVTASPVVANGKMYLIDRDATLHVLE